MSLFVCLEEDCQNIQIYNAASQHLRQQHSQHKQIYVDDLKNIIQESKAKDIFNINYRDIIENKLRQMLDIVKKLFFELQVNYLKSDLLTSLQNSQNQLFEGNVKFLQTNNDLKTLLQFYQDDEFRSKVVQEHKFNMMRLDMLEQQLKQSLSQKIDLVPFNQKQFPQIINIKTYKQDKPQKGNIDLNWVINDIRRQTDITNLELYLNKQNIHNIDYLAEAIVPLRMLNKLELQFDWCKEIENVDALTKIFKNLTQLRIVHLQLYTSINFNILVGIISKFQIQNPQDSP